MGRGGRVACIFAPMALTIGSLIAITFLEVSGWSPNWVLDSNYLMFADFSNFSILDAGDRPELTVALRLAESSRSFKKIYRIYLWNYCKANETSDKIDWCSRRESDFVFDPVEEFGLDATTLDEQQIGSNNADNALMSIVNGAKKDAKEFEEKILGEAASRALSVYRHAAQWNFIAYQIAFWTTLITIVVGLLAICSRWGSLCTWIMAVISSFFTLLASLTTTILFSSLTGALHTLLNPYNIRVSIGTRALGIAWFATAVSLVATVFWLFSICCCSGRSNPHHRSNEGGLWNAEPRGVVGSRHSMANLRKTGTGYERFEGLDVRGNSMPLKDYYQ